MANGKMVEFKTNGRTAAGYHVAGKDARRGLIVVHEWWGLNDHIRDVSDRFAAEGFNVLAPDLYEGTVTTSADEAGRLMQALDQNRALETLDGGVAYLKAQPGVEKIGVTGFCMGGSFALLLPIHNSAIAAAAPFYGDVPPDESLKKLSAPVLFIGAADDPWINMEKMNRLKAALDKFGKQGEVKIYEGVGHAFFNDTRPEAYNKAAAEDSWKRILLFFGKHL
jgi:carboxymethylenebutenolidase